MDIDMNMNKRGYVWLLILAVIFSIALYLFIKNQSIVNENPIQGNVVKDISKRVGFQGVRDPIDRSKSSLIFKGGPGKTIKGTFDKWDGTLFIKNGKIIGIEGTIDADSANTGRKAIDEKLISEDFLDAEKYSKIKFSSLALEEHEGEKRLIGDLTFMGKVQELNFPVVVKDESISADFIIDIEKFHLKDSRAGNQIRIIFEFFK